MSLHHKHRCGKVLLFLLVCGIYFSSQLDTACFKPARHGMRSTHESMPTDCRAEDRRMIKQSIYSALSSMQHLNGALSDAAFHHRGLTVTSC